MNKKILIISSDYTGHGHKSITEALCEQYSIHKDVKIHVVDGFSLGGQALLKIGKAYGPITRKAEVLWKLVYELSSVKPSLVNKIVALKIEKNLLKLLREVKPDMILSVHPNFNGSVIDILKKHNINIPFGTLIADLVSIYPLWADPRADFIISPTAEAKEKCILYGVPQDKVQVLGFPVRSRFYKSGSDSEVDFSFDMDRPIKCLLMSGGEGAGNMCKVAETLLNNFNCDVRIVAGRNAVLKERLEKNLVARYGRRARIYGFKKDIQDLMLSSDIAFTRGSPNVMMEAVSCNIPLVITGALPGQEEGNPEFAEKYNLGVVCKEVYEIPNIMRELLAKHSEKLNYIRKAQKNFSNPQIADDIVKFILNVEFNPKELKVPQAVSKFIYNNV